MPLIYCAIAFYLSFALGSLLLPLAARFNLYSRPNARRLERRGKPLIGGSAIFLSVASTALFFGFPKTILLVAYSLPLFLVGLIDDARELTARHKFPVQVLVSAAWLLSFNSSEWLLVHLGVNPVASFFMTLFWMVGIINALNLSDGIDGLAASVATITLILLAYFLHLPQPLFFAVAASATIGVLMRNWPSAKIYLGDSGSTLLGYWIACGFSILKLPATLEIHILIPLLVLAYPEFDTVFAIYRRLISGRPVWQGDRRHIHHMLRDLGLTQRGVTLTVLIVTSLLAYSAYHLGFENDSSARTLATVTVSSCIALFMFVSSLHKKWNTQNQDVGIYLFSDALEVWAPKKRKKEVLFAVKISIRDLFSHFPTSKVQKLRHFSFDFFMAASAALPQAKLHVHGEHFYVLSSTLLESKDLELLKSKFLDVLGKHHVEMWAISSMSTLNQDEVKAIANHFDSSLSLVTSNKESG